MPKWTLDKELEDTATAAGSGFSLAEKAKKRQAGTLASEPVQDADQIDQNGMMSGVRVARGGMVPARASGKRMYAKGGMVKGKCS